MRFLGATAILALNLAAGCGSTSAVCGAETLCTTTGTAGYELCSSSATNCFYATSDGMQYQCNSCSDCTGALGLANTWCGRVPTTTTNNQSHPPGETCSQPVPCPGGKTMELCTAAGNASCHYLTSDGQSFACSSCSNCQSAASAATSWCTTVPIDTGNETCTSATCPNGSTSYQFCTTGGTGSCRYQTGDGQSFACSSCSNCSAAASQLAVWCSNGNPTTASCNVGGTTGTACRACCAQQFPSGYAKAGILVDQCTCPRCPSCALMTWCGGGSSTTSTACTSCVSANATSCVSTITVPCSQDTECAAYGTCALACPSTP